MEASQDINILAALWPLAIIIFIIGTGVVLLNQQFQKKLIAQQLAREELKSRYQQKLLQTSIQVQENERKRIAQDLHDELGATLSISRMQLVLLEKNKDKHPDGLVNSLREVREIIESALASTRRISHELTPPLLVNLGLVKTLKELVNWGSKAGNLNIELNAPDELDELPWPFKIGLYRIFAELINNTLKHSGGASVAQLDISFEHPLLSCHYKDNGQGLSDSAMGEGLGMKGLEGRVEALGGKWNFGTSEDGGFFASIELLLED